MGRSNEAVNTGRRCTPVLIKATLRAGGHPTGSSTATAVPSRSGKGLFVEGVTRPDTAIMDRSTAAVNAGKPRAVVVGGGGSSLRRAFPESVRGCGEQRRRRRLCPLCPAGRKMRGDPGFRDRGCRGLIDATALCIAPLREGGLLPKFSRSRSSRRQWAAGASSPGGAALGTQRGRQDAGDLHL